MSVRSRWQIHASRVYLQNYAFSVGLDYFEPEFAVYWMRLFYAQISIATLVLIGVVLYLWQTRERVILQVYATRMDLP